MGARNNSFAAYFGEQGRNGSILLICKEENAGELGNRIDPRGLGFQRALWNGSQ
jgi:hypothetical protein